MNFYSKKAKCRNALDGRNVRPAHHDMEQPITALSPGGRVVYQRLRRSVSLCNAIAAAWSFGTVREG